MAAATMAVVAAAMAVETTAVVTVATAVVEETMAAAAAAEATAVDMGIPLAVPAVLPGGKFHPKIPHMAGIIILDYGTFCT
jgi:hypothetical protein